MTVAIIILAKNLPAFLVRQLSYYAEIGCNHPLYVVDLSEGQDVGSTPSIIAKFNNRLDINHLQLPQLTEYEANKEVSQRIQEPYVARASDDDFFIPGALEDCSMFLDANSDYTSVHGLALSFGVGLDRACGEFVTARRCPQRPAEETNGRLRLLDFLPSFWPANLCVQRTGDFRDAAALAAKPLDKNFRDLLASCVPIIRGKSKQLDRLYLMRQSHIHNSPVPYAIDWVTDPDWFSSYTLFAGYLKNELVRRDEVGLDEAEEVVQEGFGSYVAQRLANGRIATVRYLNPGPSTRWRQTAGKVPGMRGMRHLGRAIRFINPPGPDEYHLSTLLRPSSPYHSDFMPVYRAVRTPAG
jgi:glycosyltransferase domain-containing protein